MKKNRNTRIHGRKVVLVPYRREHVKRYHEWMKSPELQELTASEPLSLEQEYEMQLSWYNDEKKCTFIVLNADTYKATGDDVESMIGDVNLFYNDQEDPNSVEIEVMVAEASQRGKGYGKEAVYAMMFYGMSILAVHIFSVKIGLNNKPSLAMFEKLGFTEIARSDVFKEVTLQLILTEAVKKTIAEYSNHLIISDNGQVEKNKLP